MGNAGSLLGLIEAALLFDPGFLLLIQLFSMPNISSGEYQHDNPENNHDDKDAGTAQSSDAWFV